MKTFDEFISEWRRGPGGSKVRIEPVVTKGKGKKKQEVQVKDVTTKGGAQKKAIKKLQGDKAKRKESETAAADQVTGKYATLKDKKAAQQRRIARGKDQYEKNKTKPRVTYKDRSVPQYHPDKKTDKHGDYVEKKYPTGVYQSRTRDNRSDPYKGKNRWNWPETSRKKSGTDSKESD